MGEAIDADVAFHVGQGPPLEVEVNIVAEKL